MSVIEFISILAGIATPLTLIAACIELALSIRKNKQDKEHDKRKDTLDAYRELQIDVFDELCLKYTKNRIREVSEHYRTKENAEDYRILSIYTAKIEHFCVGVEKDIYDWETVYELAHGFLDGKIRGWLSPLMERKAGFQISDHDPFENTKNVFKKMDARTEELKRGDKYNGNI